MLLDDEEIRIMAAAQQPHLRDPGRSNSVSRRIFADFFTGKDLTGARVLELGPGHYDLADLLRAAGATVVSIDRDPSVVALGQKRGYEVVTGDFLAFDWRTLQGEFDGLVCRGSINPFQFGSPRRLGRFIDDMCSVLAPVGWGLIVPFIDIPRRYTNHVGALTAVGVRWGGIIVDAQRENFRRNGFTVYEEPSDLACRYGGGTHRAVFVRNVVPLA